MKVLKTGQYQNNKITKFEEIAESVGIYYHKLKKVLKRPRKKLRNSNRWDKDEAREEVNLCLGCYSGYKVLKVRTNFAYVFLREVTILWKQARNRCR